MSNNSSTLFIEINNFEFKFIVVNNLEDDFKIIYITSVPQQGILNNKVINYDLVLKVFKENIYLAEQKLNIFFKEVFLIVNNFSCSLISLSGYKKLNGSQLAKENITYILNSIKSKINEVENNKTIIHIFNSKFILDKKKMDNLPIGLFGDFYSHELSFFLMENTDFENLKSILNNCNLVLKKIISRNFVECANLVNQNPKIETLINIKIERTNSQITFFENSSLKFIQDFKFGLDLIIKDISKITKLNTEIIHDILEDLNFKKDYTNEELVDKKFFQNNNYKEIKIKLLFDIASARIKEFSEIVLFKNVNLQSVLNQNIPIFLMLDEKSKNKNLTSLFRLFFSKNDKYELNFLDNSNLRDNYFSAMKIVHYGWKKEAVPFVIEKKSIIVRFFELFFK